MNKKCCLCKEEKVLSDFSRDKNRKDGLAQRCKKCNTAVAKKYYREKGYKNAQSERAKKRGKDRQDLITRIKTEAGCKFCDEKDSCCLDFHHLDPGQKEYNLGNQYRLAEDKFYSELKKCIVVCANCHRKIHAGKLTVS